ncbi:hypothetical protein COLO4_22641 [Corchorus olitorius]|uniref:Uncharacterized protein n=1 Tax=Corchorus olitorius TaxID=93759 RepID=A0A1R3IKX9_9ROSI|nr:hypothetical protein COLO4_22641 [Corchorus olitorius]
MMDESPLFLNGRERIRGCEEMREDESLCRERGQVRICCRIRIRIELLVSWRGEFSLPASKVHFLLLLTEIGNGITELGLFLLNQFELALIGFLSADGPISSWQHITGAN